MRRRRTPFDALLNMDHISPFQSEHLRKFYFCLLCLSASSTLGSYSAEYINNCIALTGAVLCFYFFKRIVPWHERKRACLLSLGAYFGWAITNPWITWFLGVDPRFTVTLLSATSIGFGCYFLVLKWTNRFELVYFLSVVFYLPLAMIWLRGCSFVFAGDSTRWEHELLLLLLWGMVYVAAYSQIVMLRTRRGESDYVNHALRLFTDFPHVADHCIMLLKAICRRYVLVT